MAEAQENAPVKPPEKLLKNQIKTPLKRLESTVGVLKSDLKKALSIERAPLQRIKKQAVAIRQSIGNLLEKTKGKIEPHYNHDSPPPATKIDSKAASELVGRLRVSMNKVQKAIHDINLQFRADLVEGLLEHREETARVLGRLEYIRRLLEPYDETAAAEESAENPKSVSDESKTGQQKEKKKGYVDARQAQQFCTELKRNWKQLTFMEQARRISKINQYEKRIEKNLSAPKRHDLLASWVGLKDDTIANRLSVFDMKKFVQEAADRIFFTDLVFEHTRYLIQSGRTEECREYLQTLDQMPQSGSSHLHQRIKDRIANFHYRKIFETDEEMEKRGQIEEKLTEKEWYELNPDLPGNHPLRLNIGSESPFRLVPFNSPDYHRLRNENPEPERVILENRSGKFFVLPYIVLVPQIEKRIIPEKPEEED